MRSSNLRTNISIFLFLKFYNSLERLSILRYRLSNQTFWPPGLHYLSRGESAKRNGTEKCLSPNLRATPPIMTSVIRGWQLQYWMNTLEWNDCFAKLSFSEVVNAKFLMQKLYCDKMLSIITCNCRLRCY